MLRVASNVFSTPFKQMFYFFTPWKDQKIRGFLMIRGGKEREQLPKMD